MRTSIDIAAYLGVPAWLLTVIVIWSLVWMALGMWVAARKKHVIWYIVFLLVHTVGILEILYIFVFSKMSMKQAPTPVKAAKKKRR